MLAIVNSGGANIASVKFALARLGVVAELTSDPELIVRADKVLLPGVGAAGEGMRRLRELGLIECIRKLTQPTLGICLGMQLLFESSAEDEVQTLGLIPGRVARIPSTPGLSVPHMGWNTLEPVRASPLLDGIGASDYVYFVHSFAAPVNAATLASSRHGIEFAALVQRDNFYGMQFHPERSGPVGARILTNFLAL